MKKKTNKTQDLKWINDTFAISNVNNYSDTLTFFNLHLRTNAGDITVYGCKVITGEKGDFISFPSRKGEDDKYYNYVYIDLSEEIRNSIIDEIGTMI